MSLWFVTPAYRRYALSALCFEQRAGVIRSLAARGITARCVVVADDENLDVARSFGFDTLERDNRWLGRRFNDGIAYAAQHGAEWIVPVGSDSWIAPAFFDPLPDTSLTLTSRYYALLKRTELAELVIDGDGVGPYVIHRKRLPRGKRPSADELRSGVDGSTLKGLRNVEWQFRDTHPLQYVGIRAFGQPQLHDYRSLVRRYGVRVHRSSLWERLSRIYPADLVERTRIYLGTHR